MVEILRLYVYATCVLHLQHFWASHYVTPSRQTDAASSAKQALAATLL